MTKAAFYGHETNPITFSNDKMTQDRQFLLTTNLTYTLIPEQDYNNFVSFLKKNDDLEISTDGEGSFRCFSGWENDFSDFFVRLVEDKDGSPSDIKLPPRFYVIQVSTNLCKLAIRKNTLPEHQNTWFMGTRFLQVYFVWFNHIQTDP